MGKSLSKVVLVFEADLYGSTYKTDAAVVRVKISRSKNEKRGVLVMSDKFRVLSSAAKCMEAVAVRRRDSLD